MPVALTLIPGKVIDQILFEAVLKHNERRDGGWEWSSWIYEGEIMLSQPESFL